MNLTGITSIHQGSLAQTRPAGKNGIQGTSFKDMLMEAFQNVSQLEKESDALTNDFIAGKTDSIHSVLIAAEKASLSLEMMVQVRNKVLDAYNEIMRMQV